MSMRLFFPDSKSLKDPRQTEVGGGGGGGGACLPKICHRSSRLGALTEPFSDRSTVRSVIAQAKHCKMLLHRCLTP